MVTLSNGQKSPVFLGKGTNPASMTRCEVGFPVHKVSGTHTKQWVCALYLTGTTTARIEPRNDITLAPDVHLGEKEHLIGIYGVKDQSNYIIAIGFIAYT